MANLGRVISTDGAMSFRSGGSFTNGGADDTGAYIRGNTGVYFGDGQATATNFGTIVGRSYGVQIERTAVNATVTNGSVIDTAALIEGDCGIQAYNTAVSVANSGTIRGFDYFAISTSGGQITNGVGASPTALIEGVGGILGKSVPTSVVNMGTVSGATGEGVALQGGGSVTNGADLQTQALIEGVTGVDLTLKGTVDNLGTIAGSTGTGVTLRAGGTVTNGAIGDTLAVIEGVVGVVVAAAAGAVINLGSIRATGAAAASYGVQLADGGSVTNGGSGVTSSLISGASGVGLLKRGAVVNFSTVTGATGHAVTLRAGGTVTNGSATDTVALIEGAIGVGMALGVGTVVNFGSIKATGASAVSYGVQLADGGTVTNGAAGTTRSLIEGASGAGLAKAGLVANFGSIVGVTAAGVVLAGGGTVTNGAANDTRALISGGAEAVDVRGAVGSVANFATILSTSATDAAIYLVDGGFVTNGSITDTSAQVQGYIGVDLTEAGSVANFGSIIGKANGEGDSYYAVTMREGGYLTNGGFGDTSALISGGGGVQLYGTGALTNYGSIVGAADAGVVASNGDRIFNGRGSDTTALIRGFEGVSVVNGSAYVANLGTIQGTADLGVSSNYGGVVVNGTAADSSALIEGDGAGIYFQPDATGLGTVTNFGTVLGIDGYGVVLASGGHVTNGGGVDKTATIAGDIGVHTSDVAAQVTNFGTILGSTSDGVELSAGGSLTNGGGADRSALIEGYVGIATEVGAASIKNLGTVMATGPLGDYGVYFGAGGALTNGSVNNTTALIEGYGGASLLGGSKAASAVTATNFGTILGLGDAGGYGVVIGANGQLQDGSQSDSRALIQGYGGVQMSGAAGTLHNFGTIVATGGGAGVDLAAGGYVFNSAAGLIQGYAGLEMLGGGVATNLGAIVSLGESDAVSLVGASLTNGSVSDTAARISGYNYGVYLSTGATLTNFGTVAGEGGVAVYVKYGHVAAVVAEAGSTFVGVVDLQRGSLDLVGGVVTMGGLTTSGTVSGAGTLALDGGVLINDAGGVIDGDQALGLTINTGSSTLTNAGIIEDTGAGGTTIVGAIDNTGTVEALVGTLTAAGAVTGTGVIKIGSGAADFTSTTATLSEDVTFTGTTGVLELANSQHFTGTISGFSKTGTTSLDLADIAFTAGTTKASYSGTTTSGVLTVTSGSEVASITLEGNYTTSTFTVSSDGRGGTTVVDPTKAQVQATPAPHTFVAAMAAIDTGAPTTPTADTWRAPRPMLAAPGWRIA